jgi:hypothetical protein
LLYEVLPFKYQRDKNNKTKEVINVLKFFQLIRNKIRELRLGKGNAMTFTGKLSAKKIKYNGSVDNYGVISVQSVTTAAATYLVDSFQSSTGSPMDAFYWHACGTSSGAESTSDTALSAEVEARTSGSQEETSAMVFKSKATRTFSCGSAAIVEHGLLSLATGGTLWDRSIFEPINVSTGDSIEFTYELTVTPGG